MLLIKRAKLDRCSLKKRRKNFKLSHFSYRGKERKRSKEWRSQPGRRNRWVRISKWSSMRIKEIKFSKYLHMKFLSSFQYHSYFSKNTYRYPEYLSPCLFQLSSAVHQLRQIIWTYKKLETVSKFEFGMIGILLGLLMQGENLFDDGFIAGTATFAKLWITYT